MLAKLVIALACHAGDHGFESRTSRLKHLSNRQVLFLLPVYANAAAKQAVVSVEATEKGVIPVLDAGIHLPKSLCCKEIDGAVQ